MSLVNRRFNNATRRFLFSRAVCSYYGPHRTSTQWSSFIQSNPSLAYHIRRLDLHDYANKDIWHKLVTACSTGASLHHILFQGLALPFPWDSWDVLTARKRTLSFSLCGLPVPVLVDVVLQERTIDTVCIAENCVLTGDQAFSCTTVAACKLRVLHALSYGNRITIFSFPSLLAAIVTACEFVAELHIRVAPGQSIAVTQLLTAATHMKRLVIAFGPGKYTSSPSFNH